MYKKVLSFLNLIRAYLTKVEDFITKIEDRREEIPTTRTPTFIFLLSSVSAFILILWIELWFPFVEIESAKWALNAQVQATAAIFGLLIAAMAFRWRTITNQEEKLRSNIYSYLKQIALSVTGPQNIVPTINVAYGNYLAWINNSKPKIAKTAYMDLGRLWVIMQLSYVYRIRIKFGRHLKRGQTRELSKVSKLSREAAINMWESYYRYPAEFILNMHETLDNVSMILTGLEMEKSQEKDKQNDKNSILNKYGILGEIVSLMLGDDSKLVAEEIRERRSTLTPFYGTSVVLTLSIVIGLLVLTGISDNNLLLNLNSGIIKWAVGIPIGLSVYGVALCFLFIRTIWS